MAGRPSVAPALEDAISLAADAHRGQVYPSPEGEPYICHPLRVMLAVSGDSERLVAILHDVVEDTSMTLDDLRSLGYAAAVIQAVDCLTHRPGETYDAYIERVATDQVACRVKLADLADNLANNRRLPDTSETGARIRRYLRAQARLEAARSGWAEP